MLTCVLYTRQIETGVIHVSEALAQLRTNFLAGLLDACWLVEAYRY